MCKLHSLLHLFLSQAPLILLDFFQILLSLLCYTLLLFFNSFHSILEGPLRDELLHDAAGRCRKLKALVPYSLVRTKPSMGKSE